MMKKALKWSAVVVTLFGINASAGDQPAAPDPVVKVGDTAPNFTLKDQNGKEVKLSDFRTKRNVVLAFYVFAFTGG